jgi:hypothetical protein
LPFDRITLTPNARTFIMTQIDHISTLAVAPTGSSAPDSITLANGDIWVAYTNGADSTGLSGHSTIVEYDQSGKIDHTYQISGYVDGLKFDPVTGEIWALQNQDGNSTLSIIDPEDHTVSKPLSYAVPSSTSGYDDVVFTHGKVFMSYTNPVNPGDPTLVQLTNGNDPDHGPLTVKPILAFGDTGINLETGKTEVIPQTDPDSLKLAPNGDLLFSGGADQTIIDVHGAGTSHQSVAFTQIQGVRPAPASTMSSRSMPARGHSICRIRPTTACSRSTPPVSTAMTTTPRSATRSAWSTP